MNALYMIQKINAMAEFNRWCGIKVTVAMVLDYILEKGGPEPRKKKDWEDKVGKNFAVSARTISGKITDAIRHGFLREDSKGFFRVTDKYKKHQEMKEDGYE